MSAEEHAGDDLGGGTRLAIMGGFTLLVLAVVGAIFVALSSAKAESALTHSLQVRQAQARLFSTVQDAETGQRGYLLTGKLYYLTPFDDAEAEIPGMTHDLRTLIANDPAQERRLDGLIADIVHKMDELQRTVSHRKAGDAPGALAIVNTDEGRNVMMRIRAESSAFDQAELGTLAKRQAAAAGMRTLLLILIVGAVVTLGVLAFLVIREARRVNGQLTQRNLDLQHEMAERGRAEALLRQAQKMEALGQLTGGVAHDFNNMLAIIVGNLDMVLRRFPDGHTRLASMIENALMGAQRAAALTKRLLAFSRLQPLDPRPVDVNKCVGDMSEMLRRSLGEMVVVETVLAGGLWPAHIDAPQLESAILNLAVNARDAMSGGGRLTIETSNAALDRHYADENADVEPGQYVLVAITDTGSGMPLEILEKAFDPFFTTKAHGEGTGLGLSQVHGFLKQSRGHIKLYSEVGVGTTVKLYLPRADRAATAQDSRPAPLDASQNETFSLLVVEDDPGVRSFVASAVRELGFGVVEADSAAVALERLREHPQIALLLTDVIMPGGTGRQLADAAQALRPDLKVIYMTGYTRNAIVHNGALDPGVRLLPKPFTVVELQRELAEALADGAAGGV
jgi:signal transduction histidine kinase/ActR/RegA family two-component response regulator